MRCVALADELARLGCAVTFLCRALEGNSIEAIKHAVKVLENNVEFHSNQLYLNWLGATEEEDAEQTIKAMPKVADLLIVDSYALSQVWHKQLRPYTKKILVIDDLANRQFDCDILLNQNFGIKRSAYEGKVRRDTELLLGCEYALLRAEFAEKRNEARIRRHQSSKITNILVSLGGSDIDNVTYDVLKQIDNTLNIVVVLGSASPHNKMIKDYAKKRNIEVVIDADNMADLMLNADIAIGAGGSTSWERCCLGLPTLLCILAENQRSGAVQLEKQGAAAVIRDLANDLQAIMENPQYHKAMSDNAMSICDGLGCRR
ncbi:MAG: UDP-2,4-diacetamido-2,4,6-trideoxy-beta-L-altropyranose hydrolase, partial [Alphaproteobacteria bacterium]